MSNEIEDKGSQAEARTEETRVFSRRDKRNTRRRFTAEEKISITLEGIRQQVPLRELCRRERIHPNIYYSWLKHFMEASKERVKHDTA